MRSVSVPYVTYTLIGLNVLVFALTALQSRNVGSNASGSQLFADWALWSPGVARGELFRVVGSGFLHFGPIHLLVNMLALFLFGRFVEQTLGAARFTVLYFAALLGGSAAVLVLEQPNAVTAGASGAIFGVFGAYALILVRLRQNPTAIVAMIVLNLVISISVSGVSLWGHTGGLIAGTAAAAGLLYAPQWLGRTVKAPARTIGWAALGAVVAFTLAVIAVRALQLHSEFVSG